MRKFMDLTGQQFGKLTVEELVGKDKYYDKLWKCRCECGNTVIVRQGYLRSGEVLSCGCSVNSKGEKIVFDWLQQHGISYVYHKSFDDCLSNEGYKLNFDFYLELQNTIVECNGQQHYEPIDFFGGEKRFKVQLEHDKLKKEYAYRYGINYLVLDCRRANLKQIESQLSDFLLNC